jgi:hypothetical protein
LVKNRRLRIILRVRLEPGANNRNICNLSTCDKYKTRKTTARVSQILLPVQGQPDVTRPNFTWCLEPIEHVMVSKYRGYIIPNMRRKPIRTTDNVGSESVGVPCGRRFLHVTVHDRGYPVTPTTQIRILPPSATSMHGPPHPVNTAFGKRRWPEMKWHFRLVATKFRDRRWRILPNDDIGFPKLRVLWRPFPYDVFVIHSVHRTLILQTK